MKYVAFFRGINVGKKNIIKMADLKDIFIKLGYKNPETYLRSGNVIFESENKDKESIATDIEDNLKGSFDISVPVFVKNIEEIAEIIENNPFKDCPKESIEKLYFTLLSNKPDKNLVQKLNKELKDYKNNYNGNKEDMDDFIIIDSVVYLLCNSKYHKTKFNNNYFESKLKEIATTRNWKTMNKIAKNK
jgi:uncharacterized protein (DUF1697 family)